MAGADCIDVASDPVVVSAAHEGLQAAQDILQTKCTDDREPHRPWLMVSLNDGEDPHFRKAVFEPDRCPADCPRPCESICPAGAIVFDQPDGRSGVTENRCYGCGRCLPVCPIQQIDTRSYLLKPETLSPLILDQIDAIEIHTQPGRYEEFQHLWQTLKTWIPSLRLIAISCPGGDGFIDYLGQLRDLMSPLHIPVIWQLDGRPMSGDIGNGTTRATIKLGQQILATQLPGYIQLAGGTNRHTVTKLQQLNLLNTSSQSLSHRGVSGHTLPFDRTWQHSDCAPHPPYISGIAYGSYARTLVAPVLDQLEAFPPIPTLSSDLRDNRWLPQAIQTPTILTNALEKLPHDPSLDNSSTLSNSNRLEDHPKLMKQAVQLASELVSQLKDAVKSPLLHPRLEPWTPPPHAPD